MISRKNKKRYFAVLWPKKLMAQAIFYAGYERGNKLFQKGKMIGFAVDYYPDEKSAHEREFGNSIIGDYATMAEAHAAIDEAMGK
jgi:hypothetical protein